MGTITKGILGGFSGTVGTVVGGNWKGIDYIRSQAPRRSGTSTDAQKDQRLRFALVMRFLQSMAGLLGISFRTMAVKMTGMNSAVSYCLRNAVGGISPAFFIDYSLVLVSRGDLPNGGNPSAAAAAGGDITFSWTDNTGIGKAAATDKPLLVVYCEELNQATYTDGVGARSEGSAVLNASAFSGKVVETWLGFFSADGKGVATSVYTGQLTVL